jgi:hypothetical protein
MSPPRTARVPTRAGTAPREGRPPAHDADEKLRDRSRPSAARDGALDTTVSTLPANKALLQLNTERGPITVTPRGKG